MLVSKQVKASIARAIVEPESLFASSWPNDTNTLWPILALWVARGSSIQSYRVHKLCISNSTYGVDHTWRVFEAKSGDVYSIFQIGSYRQFFLCFALEGYAKNRPKQRCLQKGSVFVFLPLKRDGIAMARVAIVHSGLGAFWGCQCGLRMWQCILAALLVDVCSLQILHILFGLSNCKHITNN